MRIFYLIFGFLTLGIGMIGVFVPLLPTTPLVLLSAFCFARSSKRFHSWLLNHPRFGTMIKDWQENGSISKEAKNYAFFMIALSLVLSLILQVPQTVLLIQCITLSCVVIFIITRPSK